MQNEMLIKAEAAIDAKVPPNDKEAYDKIVLAGMKVMFSKDTHQQLMQSLQGVSDFATAVPEGIIGVLGILFKESRYTMPPVPMILAGQSLMMEALDFMEQARMLEVTPQVLEQATQHYVDTLFKTMLPKLGLTSDKMNGLVSQAKNFMADPEKLAAYKKSMEG